ncbi:MAG: hypothetical protein CEE38_04175 [Planctomycetes bacterium B3_Pla]|nr:MAG: hypothetical protein CEE38_04175 [Planctomycetes bacterium B3_Pla]
MWADLFASAFEHIKGTRFYQKIERLLAIGCLFVTVHVLTYKYIEWWYHLSLELGLYLRGYLFKLITLCFLLVLGVVLIISRPVEKTGRQEMNRLRQFLRKHTMVILWRSACVILGAFLFALATLYVLPQRADNIKIGFLTEPEEAGFDKYALVYMVYELNNRQKYWHFDVIFKEFNENTLTSKQRKTLSSEPEMMSLSRANLLAENEPLIGITADSLGTAFFFQNNIAVSVISTYEWNELFSPPTIYEYLAYSLIQQSILIHLNNSTRGLPVGAFESLTYSHGNLFEGTPERMAMKATMLAARLSPKGEELLLNSFGLNYMQTCADLLTLRWLKSGEVSENLKRNFGVDLSAAK